MKTYQKLFETYEEPSYRGVERLTISEIKERVRSLIEEEKRSERIGYDEDGAPYEYGDRMDKLWESTANRLTDLFDPSRMLFFTSDFPDTDKAFRKPIERIIEDSKNIRSNSGVVKTGSGIFLVFPEFEPDEGYVSYSKDNRIVIASRVPQ
jgi:hypothetical protein